MAGGWERENLHSKIDIKQISILFFLNVFVGGDNGDRKKKEEAVVWWSGGEKLKNGSSIVIAVYWNPNESSL